MLTYDIEYIDATWTVIQCIRDGYEIVAVLEIDTDDALSFNSELEQFKIDCEDQFSD